MMSDLLLPRDIKGLVIQYTIYIWLFLKYTTSLCEVAVEAMLLYSKIIQCSFLQNDNRTFEVMDSVQKIRIPWSLFISAKALSGNY